MNKAWAKRIQRLESILQTRVLPPVVFRYGSVKRLPITQFGERHVVVVEHEPTALLNVERCEFEEQIGAAPASLGPGFTVFLSLADEKEDPP